MAERAEDAIVRLLMDRAPNLVSELIIRQRLKRYDGSAISDALQKLINGGKITVEEDHRDKRAPSVNYYRLTSYDGIPVRDSIILGDQEIIRVLSISSPRFLPEDLNEQIERLAEYTNGLERRFADLVREEQRGYWANIVTVFGVFVSILTLIIVGLPKITASPSLSPWTLVWLNLGQLLPIAVVLALFVFLLRCVIR
jgi:hypothetical protein